MGLPPWLTERDVDLSYLLGPFDARRMIQLWDSPAARQISSAMVRLQRDFPTAVRNLAYVSFSALMHEDSRNFQYGRRDHIKATYLGLASEIDAGLLRTSARPWDGVPLIAFDLGHTENDQDAQLLEYASHEYSHVIDEELALSDWLLGTNATGEIHDAIESVVPGLRKDECESYYTNIAQNLGMADAGGVFDYHELVTEVIRHAIQPGAIPLGSSQLTIAASKVGRILEHYWEPEIRQERQLAILESAKSDPTLQWFGYGVTRQLHNALRVAHSSWNPRAPFKAEAEVMFHNRSRDSRFGMACLNYELEGVVFGLDRIRLMYDVIRQKADPEPLLLSSTRLHESCPERASSLFTLQTHLGGYNALSTPTF